MQIILSTDKKLKAEMHLFSAYCEINAKEKNAKAKIVNAHWPTEVKNAFNKTKSSSYFEGKKGDNINLYNDQFEIRPFSELISEGLLTLKGNQKLVGNSIVEKTLQEQFDDGFLKLEN